MQNLNAVSQTV